MESCDDEKDGGYENLMPKALSPGVASGGAKFVDEVLNGQDECCLDNFWMDKNVFYKLCQVLQSRGLLRHTNGIKIEEQLAIFLFIIGHNLRTQAVRELFRYSGETISRHFNNVLIAITAVSLDFFQPPKSDVPQEVLENPRLYPYFKDCVRAVDCIPFLVTVAVDEQGPFRNKNSLLMQNVQLVHLTSSRHYLVDTKSVNLPGFLSPYHDVPYHLNGLPGDRHLQDAKDVFNQWHSLLRNSMNRIFSALKARFPILTSTPPYPLQTQVKLVVTGCAIHNYIHIEKPDDWLFRRFEHGDVMQMDDALPSVEVEQPMFFENQDLDFPFVTEDLEMSLQLRDLLATEM
ncbi:hypothetical protein EUGRSUZ_B00883 [Eucalyptus grandis]|uniref:Uncharacterized protein n=2 Tax=Eucalyptus grandis TaxID=71139 RepID=A0ACC3LQK1_EUCGR|nr:hypothetical protein EUGRSUZ_B00883 [Eucalyptus grandis]